MRTDSALESVGMSMDYPTTRVLTVLDAALTEAERWVAPLFATLREEDGSVFLGCSTADLDWLARVLVSLPFAFRVRTPPELREALLQVQARIDDAISI